MLELNEIVFSQSIAQKLLDAIEAQARECGQSLAISIVGSSGQFACYRRMDDVDSAAVKQAGRQALRIAQRSAQGYTYGARTAHDQSTTLARAIVAENGTFVGGIGICGGTEDVARRCVAAALATLPTHL